MSDQHASPDLDAGWTLAAYIAHNEARRGDADKFYEERDRRYSEVNIEREKALKIKETADLAALGLAREIQTYKDEKANELREQINSERGLYATKEDLRNLEDKLTALIKPLSEFVIGAAGGKARATDFRTWIIAGATLVFGYIAAGGKLP
jgi:hypothetical protein